MASREVAAPAERVWEVVTDIEGSVTVLSAVDAIERLDDGQGFTVGTRWRETRTMLGRQATEEMEVTAVDAPRTYTVVASDATTTYTSTITLEPRGAQRCLLSMTFAGSSSGLVARVLAATVGRVFAGATRRALEQDLDDIAARAEAGSAA
ncbi:MAG: SRPBCC family protein [Nitriliruptoraceae bacterium]